MALYIVKAGLGIDKKQQQTERNEIDWLINYHVISLCHMDKEEVTVVRIIGS